MMAFSDSYKVIIWFSLCAFLALGMIAFAVIYGVLTFVFNKLAWKEINNDFTGVKLPKIRTVFN